MKRYLIITDMEHLEMREDLVKNDLVLASQGKYIWVIDLQQEKAFSVAKNAWLPFKEFPVFEF